MIGISPRSSSVRVIFDRSADWTFHQHHPRILVPSSLPGFWLLSITPAKLDIVARPLSRTGTEVDRARSHALSEGMDRMNSRVSTDAEHRHLPESGSLIVLIICRRRFALRTKERPRDNVDSWAATPVWM